MGSFFLSLGENPIECKENNMLYPTSLIAFLKIDKRFQKTTLYTFSSYLSPSSVTGYPGNDSQQPPKQMPGGVGFPCGGATCLTLQNGLCRISQRSSTTISQILNKPAGMQCLDFSETLKGFGSAFPAKANFVSFSPFEILAHLLLQL